MVVVVDVDHDAVPTRGGQELDGLKVLRDSRPRLGAIVGVGQTVLSRVLKRVGWLGRRGQVVVLEVLASELGGEGLGELHKVGALVPGGGFGSCFAGHSARVGLVSNRTCVAATVFRDGGPPRTERVRAARARRPRRGPRPLWAHNLLRRRDLRTEGGAAGRGERLQHGLRLSFDGKYKPRRPAPT